MGAPGDGLHLPTPSDRIRSLEPQAGQREILQALEAFTPGLEEVPP